MIVGIDLKDSVSVVRVMCEEEYVDEYSARVKGIVARRCDNEFLCRNKDVKRVVLSFLRRFKDARFDIESFESGLFSDNGFVSYRIRHRCLFIEQKAMSLSNTMAYPENGRCPQGCEGFGGHQIND